MACKANGGAGGDYEEVVGGSQREGELQQGRRGPQGWNLQEGVYSKERGRRGVRCKVIGGGEDGAEGSLQQVTG